MSRVAESVEILPDPAVATVLIGPDGRILACTSRFARAVGLPRQAPGRLRPTLLGDRLGTDARRAWCELIREAHRTPGRPATKVVELPTTDGVAVVCLFEALAQGPDTLLREVHGHSELEAQLVHFRLAAKLGGFGLWTYDPHDGRWQWHGGRPRLSATRISVEDPADAEDGSPQWFVDVHPEDRADLARRIDALAPGGADEDRTMFRVRGADGWHWIASHMRRLRLGIDGRDVVVGVDQDQTEVVRLRAEAEQRLRAERRRGERLAEVSAALIRAVTETELNAVMIERVAPVFGGTGALVALVEHDRLRMSFGPGVRASLMPALERITLSAMRPLPWAIRTGEPLFVESRAQHTARWPQAPELIEATGARAYAVIPFAGKERPIGGLVVTYDREHRPTEDERALMRTFGQLAGQAIERIRLQQARAELAVALQRTMLPARLPEVPGLEIAVRYAPARGGLSVGGDWYDVIAREDGTALVAIGDAQGHDVDAAAFMGQVRTTKRAFAAEDPDPGRVLRRTNDLLAALHRGTFASCTLMGIDPATGACAVGRAGHVPMIVLTPDGQSRVLETPGGPVLGIVEGADYPTHELRLALGSVVVLVTDGVVESREQPIDVGLERVAERARACAGGSVAEIADAVLSAADETGNVDDAALLVLRLSAPGERPPASV